MPCCKDDIHYAQYQCQHAKQCAEFREVLKPNGQLERAGADVEPQGRGRGGLQGAGQGLLCANVTYTGVQWHVTEVQRAEGGLRTTVGRSRALPTPNRGLAGRIGGGRWAQGGAKSKRSCF